MSWLKIPKAAAADNHDKPTVEEVTNVPGVKTALTVGSCM